MPDGDVHSIDDSLKRAEKCAQAARQVVKAADAMNSNLTEEALLAKANFLMLNAIYYQLCYAQDMQSINTRPLLAHTNALNDHILAMDRLRLAMSANAETRY